MSIKLNVEDRFFSAHSLDLQNMLTWKNRNKKLSDVILQHHSVLLWTCMVFQSCCILSLLSFLFCNLYFQMQNLKDYFGYVHACVMFRMLISTKSCWVWNKSRLVLKIKCLTFRSVATALLFILPFIHFIYRTVMYSLDMLWMTNSIIPRLINPLHFSTI